MPFFPSSLRLVSCLAVALSGCAGERAQWTVPVVDGRDASLDVGCEVSPPSLVQVDDAGRFVQDDRTFVPRGINSYPLLELAGEGRIDALSDIYAQAHLLERPIVRANEHIDSRSGPARIRLDDGSLREQGLRALDLVLASAAEHGVQLILTLTNNWKDFGGAKAVLNTVHPGRKLPKNAFWSDERAIEAQLAYQHAIITRVNSINGRSYADDPTIFAWELANEARCEADYTPKLCTPDTLSRWARRMSTGLRASGARQLISWGGSGYLGRYGEDLSLIAEHGAVDILTFHMYALAAHGDGAPGAIAWGDAALRERAHLAQRMKMPLLLEEANWQPHAERTYDGERAEVLSAWLATANELSVGTLPWMIGERDRKDYDGYLITVDDPQTLETIAWR